MSRSANIAFIVFYALIIAFIVPMFFEFLQTDNMVAIILYPLLFVWSVWNIRRHYRSVKALKRDKNG